MYKLHVKIGDFEFVETLVELNQLTETYHQIKEAFKPFKPKVGLERLEWNKLLDGFLNSSGMDVEKFELCSEGQKLVISELRKAFKRINPNKDEIHS